MIQEAVKMLLNGENLPNEVMKKSIEEIMEGKAHDAQTGAFLALLANKGETSSEIASAAEVMREKSEKINLDIKLLDTCSTGGSSKERFNISTTSALVLAGGGVSVAKHGNRAVSGRCGSADILEAFGVRVDISPKAVKDCIEKVGIGFMFAPVFHKAMKNAAGPRKALGIRSIFNLLGPLTNPAAAEYQVLGVYSEEILPNMAEALLKLNLKRAMVVHGSGLDEITLSGSTKVAELSEGGIKEYEITPDSFNLKPRISSEYGGGDTKENLRIIRKILIGEKGAFRDIVVANAAAGFIVYGLAGNFLEGRILAEESIDSGRAEEKIKKLVEFTRGCSK